MAPVPLVFGVQRDEKEIGPIKFRQYLFGLGDLQYRVAEGSAESFERGGTDQ